MSLSYSRDDSVRIGIAANEAEGLQVSRLFLDLASEYVRGDIDLRQFHDEIDLHYCGKRNVSNGISECIY